MNIIAVNGSPRKKWNTATLLKNALKGANSLGAETELINLYQLAYKGCTSCFSCKRKNGKRACAMNDELTDVLEKAKSADAIIFGSPIYFMSVSSGMSAFLERFLYPFIIYSNEIPTVFPRRIPAAFIYTMNASRQMMEPFKTCLNPYEKVVEIVLQERPELLYSYDTYQYPDYNKYEHSKFSEEEKAKQKAEQFPIDCEHAFQMGMKMVKNMKNAASLPHAAGYSSSLASLTT